MKSLTEIRQATLAKSKRLSRDTAQVVTIGDKKVSVSTKRMKKSITQFAEEKRKELSTIQTKLEEAKEDAKVYSDSLVDKANQEAKAILARVEKLEQSVIEKEKLLQKELESAVQSASWLKTAQNQTEKDRDNLTTTLNDAVTQKEALLAKNVVAEQAKRRIQTLLGELAEVISVVSERIRPLLDIFEGMESGISEKLEILSELENKLATTEMVLSAQKSVQEETDKQQSSEWAIIKDKRQQLDRVAFELKQKQNG